MTAQEELVNILAKHSAIAATMRISTQNLASSMHARHVRQATAPHCGWCSMTRPAEWLCDCLSFELPKFSRLGRLAAWYCGDCMVERYQGRFPCTDCCGYTTRANKVARGVKTAWGRPNVRCVP